MLEDDRHTRTRGGKVPEDKLIDLAGIAELLGVASVTPSQWRQRGVLPEPDLSFPDKPLWKRQTIIDWAKETDRWPPGRAARVAMRSTS